jgi:hypothetical protein
LWNVIFSLSISLLLAVFKNTSTKESLLIFLYGHHLCCFRRYTHTHFCLILPPAPTLPHSGFCFYCSVMQNTENWRKVGGGGTYPSTAATPLTPPNRVHTHYIPFFDSCQLERMTSWTQNSNTTTLCLNFAASLELESIIRYLVLTFFLLLLLLNFSPKKIYSRCAPFKKFFLLEFHM